MPVYIIKCCFCQNNYKGIALKLLAPCRKRYFYVILSSVFGLLIDLRGRIRSVNNRNIYTFYFKSLTVISGAMIRAFFLCYKFLLQVVTDFSLAESDGIHFFVVASK